MYLITTGKLRTSEQLPSVRSLARTLKIHHNTVSKSYGDLVSRGWLKRQRGSRLCVGNPLGAPKPAADLDELINHSIRRANELGYSLQALRSKVLERLSAEPPDHILVVESEPELRGLICSEIHSRVGKVVRACSKEEFLATPEFSFGAQVVAPEHTLPAIASFLPLDRPGMGLTFAGADEIWIRFEASPSHQSSEWRRSVGHSCGRHVVCSQPSLAASTRCRSFCCRSRAETVWMEWISRSATPSPCPWFVAVVKCTTDFLRADVSKISQRRWWPRFRRAVQNRNSIRQASRLERGFGFRLSTVVDKKSPECHAPDAMFQTRSNAGYPHPCVTSVLAVHTPFAKSSGSDNVRDNSTKRRLTPFFPRFCQ